MSLGGHNITSEGTEGENCEQLKDWKYARVGIIKFTLCLSFH